MKVPVILLNYNSSLDCRKCISFLKCQEGVELEIIVVDNCSPRKGEIDTIKALCTEQDCTFIAASANRGYNAGNNIGLRYAADKRYKYALIANPDMEFPQVDYVAKLVSTMEKDEQVIVCASDIITPTGRHQNPMRESRYTEDLFWPITMLKNRKNKNWFLMDYTHSGYCEKISGCCFMIRLSFIESIGFFDENTFLYSEEAILAKQVTNSGKKAYYLSEIQALHRHIKCEKGNAKKRMQQMMLSRNYYLTRYSGYSQFKLFMLKISQFIERQFLKLTLK